MPRLILFILQAAVEHVRVRVHPQFAGLFFTSVLVLIEDILTIAVA